MDVPLPSQPSSSSVFDRFAALLDRIQKVTVPVAAIFGAGLSIFNYLTISQQPCAKTTTTILSHILEGESVVVHGASKAHANCQRIVLVSKQERAYYVEDTATIDGDGNWSARVQPRTSPDLRPREVQAFAVVSAAGFDPYSWLAELPSERAGRASAGFQIKRGPP